MNTVGVSLFELVQVRTMNFPLVTVDYASFLLISGPPSSVCVCVMITSMFFLTVPNFCPHRSHRSWTVPVPQAQGHREGPSCSSQV